MTDIVIKIERDCHDDNKFTVVNGTEIEAIFYRKSNLIAYLKQRIDDISGRLS